MYFVLPESCWKATWHLTNFSLVWLLRAIHNHRKYCQRIWKIWSPLRLKFGPSVFFLSDSLMESKWWSFKPYFNSHGGFANWITSYTFIRELNTHEDIVGTKTAKFVWQAWPSCSIEEKSKYTRKMGSLIRVKI